MEKMTNVKALEYVVANYEVPTDVAEKLNSMIASLHKKSASRKPSKTQAENEVLKDTILEVLANGGKMTASAVLKSHEDFDGFSNQKISALLNGLVKDGKVTKDKDKKTTVFFLAE